MTNQPFMDFGKILEQFKLPGVDMNAIMEARRKDIEALVQANQQAIENAQALGKRQAEMLQQAVTEFQSALGEAGASAGRQGELAKQALEKTLANLRELAEMAAKSQAQAAAAADQRFRENLEDLKKLMQPAQPK